MSLIYLVHPDEAVRKALQATLGAVWPDITFEGVTHAPDTLPAHSVAYQPVSPAQRLKPILLYLQQQMCHAYWPSVVAIGSAQLNTRTREFKSGGDTILLTEKEVGILLYLHQRQIAASREDLLRDVWNYASDADTHTIETHIYRLRQKIEADPANPVFLVTTKDGYQVTTV